MTQTASIISKVWSFCHTLPDPDVIALDIVENLEAGLESFREIVAGLNGG